MSLRALGWDRLFEEALLPWARQGCVGARVAVQHRGGYEVWTADGILAADVSGRFRHQSKCASDFPAVGDWVAIEPQAGTNQAVIHAVLPRRTRLSRNAPGDATVEQLVVTNVDEIFVLESMAPAPNLRRIERFLAFAAESGAPSTVVLTKADLATDVPGAIATVAQLGHAAEVLAISSINGEGLEAIRKRIKKGRTIVVVGRSGVGKSTLINQLVGEETQFVLPVRSDDQKGRHATTSREMVFLSGGGIVIDTPGLRELQIWEGADGLESSFPDVEAIALRCRFSNCQHNEEPGCAVREALRDGALGAARLAAFLKIRDETAESTRRRDRRARVDTQHQARNRRRHGNSGGRGAN